MTSVFAESYLRHHPGSTVYVCLVDRPHPRVDYEIYPFEIILAEDLEIPNFFNFAFKYDILELNTAVKPFVFKYLRDQKGVDRAFYFDPDILVHDHLRGLEEALDAHQAVLTPHLTKPLDNVCRPPERVIGMCGIYNLGFVGLQLNEGTQTFLDWWCDRLYRYCINDLTNGMFVDQSWMDFAPVYLDSVAIMRDEIYNIAYWNLPGRRPVEKGNHWEIEGRRVGFFHFSGVDPRDLDAVSKHQDRFDLYERPELRPLFEHYAKLVNASGHHEMRDIPYFYNSFRDSDIPIPRFARGALMEVDPEGLRWPDPFDTECDDSFLSWLSDPIATPGGLLNRTALFLWRVRRDLREVFPKIEAADCHGYRNWYLEGGGEEAGLHRFFINRLRSSLIPVGGLEEKRDMDRFLKILLDDPCDDLEWLNEELVRAADGSRLTRFALLLHEERPDLQQLYPDPAVSGGREYLYWICRYGSEILQVAEGLIHPLRRQLSLKSRTSLALRSWRGKGEPGREITRIRPEVKGREFLVSNFSSSSVPGPGLNILGFFEGIEALLGLASVFAEAVENSTVPVLRVGLDHPLPELMTSDLIRFERGLPFGTTLLVCPSDMWAEIAGRLPIGVRWGSRIVGYALESAQKILKADLSGITEIWTPGEENSRVLASVLRIPVRQLAPPPIPPLQGAPDGGQARGQRRALAVVRNSSGEELRTRSALIEAFRRFRQQGGEGLRLRILDCSGERGLGDRLSHLPVDICEGRPDGAALVREILEADVVIALDPGQGISRHQLMAWRSGKAVFCRRDPMTEELAGELSNFLIATGPEAPAEWIDGLVLAMGRFVEGKKQVSLRSFDRRQNGDWVSDVEALVGGDSQIPKENFEEAKEVC